MWSRQAFFLKMIGAARRPAAGRFATLLLRTDKVLAKNDSWLQPKSALVSTRVRVRARGGRAGMAKGDGAPGAPGLSLRESMLADADARLRQKMLADARRARSLSAGRASASQDAGAAAGSQEQAGALDPTAARPSENPRLGLRSAHS